MKWTFLVGRDIALYIEREEILELKSALLSLHVLGSRKESFLVDILALDVRKLVSGGYKYIVSNG